MKMQNIHSVYGSSKWSNEESKYLQQLIQIYGKRNWKIIAECLNDKFPNREKSAKACRRYCEKKSSSCWGDEQRFLLLVAHQIIGNQWAAISQALHQNNANIVKNKFYTLLRKILHHIQQQNTESTDISQLDLFESIYIAKLILELKSNKSNSASCLVKLIANIEPRIVTLFLHKYIDLPDKRNIEEDLYFSLKKKYTSEYQQLLAFLRKQSEIDKCSEIPLLEEGNYKEEKLEIQFTLPEPIFFSVSTGIDLEEKDFLWKWVFHSKKDYPTSPLLVSAITFSSSASACQNVDPSQMAFSNFAGRYDLNVPE